MNHPQVALGEVADFVNGAAFKPEDWGEDGLPIIRIQNLTDPGKPFNYTERIVTEKLVVYPGDLLVSWSATLGVFQWTGPKGLLNQHIFRVLPNDEVVDRNYLRHVLGKAINDMERHLHGATMKHVNRGEFLGTRIPLPPLEEQRRIAAILDQATNVENLAAGQLLNLDELACSFFEKTIADARQQGTLNEQRLGDISIVAGQYGATCSSAPYDTNLPRYVRITDVQDNGLLSPDMVSPAGPSTTWSGLRLDPGDLLFARSGATVGKSYMYTSEDGACVFAGYLIRFRLNPSLAIPEFVYGFTRTEAYRSWITTTQRVVAQPNINAKQYASLTIPLPPLSEQRAYCSTYRHIKKQSQIARKRLAHVSRLRQSLSKSLLDDQGGKP